VTDIHGNTNTATQNVVVTDNENPTITAPATVNANNDAGVCSATVSSLGTPVTGDNCGVNSVTNDHPSSTYPVGTTTVTWTVTDIHGNTNTATQNVVVQNTTPVITTITASSVDPIQKGTAITLSVSYTDGANSNVTSATVNWGDGTIQSSSSTTNPILVTHTYSSTGVYEVLVTVSDACGAGSNEYHYQYVVVFDPSGGFVTGGGWIISQPGAYITKPDATGRANFGFNAQYKKGSNTPDGNTQFQFQAGDLNFHSSEYDYGSLVIAGAKALYKGTGTINGIGGYSFMVSAIDGDMKAPVTADRFRMKIWVTASGVTVYDNNNGAPDAAEASTDINGGSIVIHTANGKNSTREMSPAVTGSAVEVNGNQVTEQTGTGKLTVKVMPNPTSYYFTAGLQSLSKEKVKLVVTDMTGRVIEQRTDVQANSTIQLGGSYHPGMYIAQFMQGTDIVTLRLIKEGR
jgi:hypothetical protein